MTGLERNVAESHILADQPRLKVPSDTYSILVQANNHVESPYYRVLKSYGGLAVRGDQDGCHNHKTVKMGVSWV